MNNSPQYPGEERLVHLVAIVYFLQAVSIIGLPSIMGMMITDWAAIGAVCANYARLESAQGTWLKPHFLWQIKTFWYSHLCWALAVFVIMPVEAMAGLALFYLAGAWVLYRVIKGWLKLRKKQPIVSSAPTS